MVWNPKKAPPRPSVKAENWPACPRTQVKTGRTASPLASDQAEARFAAAYARLIADRDVPNLHAHYRALGKSASEKKS